MLSMPLVSVSIISLLLTLCLFLITRRSRNPFTHILTPAEMEMDLPLEELSYTDFDMQKPLDYWMDGGEGDRQLVHLEKT